MSWLWFSCLALLFLLPPVSFAQSHLWQYRPFRANDTDHSGGDHICDLRRDSNADGKPDKLGEYVTVSGTVRVGDFALKKSARAVRCGMGAQEPRPVHPRDYAARPGPYAGTLVSLTRPVRVVRTTMLGEGCLAWAFYGTDSLVAFVDDDFACAVTTGRCYMFTGVVISIIVPSGSQDKQAWCIAPRGLDDIRDVGCVLVSKRGLWGHLKTEFDQ